MSNSSAHKTPDAISRPFIATQSHRRQSLLLSFARKLYPWIVTLSTPRSQLPKLDGKVRVVCISDTHNTKPALPEGDILVHAGDFSQYGTFKEVQSQLDWLNQQPHSHKIVIAGNHDLILDDAFVKAHPDRELWLSGSSREDLDWGNITYLQNSSVQIACNERTLRIYGSPMTPECGNFAFQYKPEEDIWANTVPGDLDIFVTHGPPALHLDEGKGCQHLLNEIWRSRPKLVVFGHIHGGRGEDNVTFDRAQKLYEDTVLDVRPWLNTMRLIFLFVSHLLTRGPTMERGSGSTYLVNAAMVAGPDQKRREAIVAYV